MAKWYQQILGGEIESRDESFVKNKSIRAYELFKKNRYKVINQEGNFSTNKKQTVK